MRRLIAIGLFVSTTLSAQITENLIRVVPVPGTGVGSVGRIDYFDHTRTYAVHVNALPGLTANIPWVWPSVADTAGQCLVSGGLGRWNPASCTGTPPLTYSASSASAILTLTNSGSGHALDVTSGLTSVQALSAAGNLSASGTVSGSHLQNLGTGDIVQFAGALISNGLTVSANGISSSANVGFAGNSLTNAGGGVGANITSGGTTAASFSDSGGTCFLRFSAGGVTCPSDIRLKKNVSGFGSVLSRLMQLRPVGFEWKQSGQHADGLIAQEVQKVFPLAVHRTPDGILNISYQQLTPYLIRSIQEQQSEIRWLQGGFVVLSIAVVFLFLKK